MARKISMLAPDWWDYTTLDDEILNDAAKLTAEDMAGLSREGFKVVFYDTLEDFYLAEALEYITAWKQATADNPVGVCGPIGPTEQLPLVARLVNELGLNLANAHFWGMDEWYMDGKEAPVSHPLSFAKAQTKIKGSNKPAPYHFHLFLMMPSLAMEKGCQRFYQGSVGGQFNQRHLRFFQDP